MVLLWPEVIDTGVVKWTRFMYKVGKFPPKQCERMQVIKVCLC